jgi:cell division protein FtsI (penicillin-binding protein 3)
MSRDDKLNGRLRNFVFFGLALFVVLFARLVELQFFHHDRYRARAIDQHYLKETLPADRGTIYDRRGRPLAVSRDIISVYADPQVIADPAGAGSKIAKVLGLSSSCVRKKLASSKQFVWLSRRQPYMKKKELQELGITGLGFREGKGRYYPAGSQLAQVIGFCGVDNRGLWGLEESLEEYLLGTDGWAYLMKDACGRTYVDLSLPKQDPIPGHEVVLTIDTRLQEIVELALKRAVRDAGAEGGSIVAVDPRTGDILAMASYPTVDLYRLRPPLGDGIYDLLRNRATMDLFEPGSTFKLISMASLIEQGAVRPDELVFCENGSYRIGRRTIEDAHPEQWLTVKDVFARSSNIGMVKLIERIAEDDFVRRVKDFGIGSATGIRFVPEENGILNQPDSPGWSGYTVQSMAYGQEVSVTALQMAMAYAAVANGGDLLVPNIVKEVRTSDGRTVWSSGRKVLWRPVSRETSRLLKAFLAEVVESGTGRGAAIGSFPIAGKTGTAEQAVPGKGYVDGLYVSSFGGFFPVDDPAVVIFTAIDKPQEKYYGSEVAVPAFREITEGVLLSCPDLIGGANLARVEGINRVFATGARPPGGTRAAAAPGGQTLYVFPVSTAPHRVPPPGEETAVMPDLVGLSSRDALRVALAGGLEPIVSGDGFVFRQKPGAGAVVPRGTECYLAMRTTGAW